jgi:hypothetical protein
VLDGGARAVAAALQTRADVIVVGRRDPGWPPVRPVRRLVNATPFKNEVVVESVSTWWSPIWRANVDGRPTAPIEAARGRLPPCVDTTLRPGRRVAERWTGRLRRSSRCGPRRG